MIRLRRHTAPNGKSLPGFTLIELMVSISIFAVVALIVSSTIAILLASFHRSEDLKLILDNLNFAMQNMTLNIKEGTNYVFTSGDSVFSFKENSGTADVTANCSDNTFTYLLCPPQPRPGVVQSIYKVCSTQVPLDGSCPAAAYQVTSNEIHIDSLQFTGNRSAQSGTGRVTIYMRGEALSRGATTTFDLQTTISQRQTESEQQ